MTESDAIELLTGSILMPHTFTTFDGFLQGSSIAITHLELPLILLGPAQVKQSIEVAERLVNEEQFHLLTGYLFGAGELLIKRVSHKECFQTEKCFSVVQSTQGKLEYGEEGDHNIIAILPHPNQKKAQAFALGLCICNNLMKCFIPNSKDLPINSKLRYGATFING